jgi:hypothetical protein
MYAYTFYYYWLSDDADSDDGDLVANIVTFTLADMPDYENGLDYALGMLEAHMKYVNTTISHGKYVTPALPGNNK